MKPEPVWESGDQIKPPRSRSLAYRQGGITPQQRHFVFEYLVDLDATRAALAAGYETHLAKSVGARLLKYPGVRRLIDEIQDSRFRSLNITGERVLKEVARLAFIDARKFFNEDGTVRDISTLDDDTAAALSGFEVSEIIQRNGNKESTVVGHVKKIKLADKGENLERLGRHLGLFTPKVEVQVTGTVEHILSEREQEDARKAVAELRAYDGEVIDVEATEVTDA